MIGFGVSSGVGPLFDLVQQRLEFASRRRVRRVDEFLENGFLGFLRLIGGTGRRRLPTVRAPVVMRGQRLLAIPAVLSDPVRAVFGVEDTSLAEDVVVVFLRRDVLVGLPHVGVERPVDTMLDLRSRVPLADHPCDRRVSKRVRRDVLLEISAIGDSLELLVRRVRVDGSIIGPALSVLAAAVRFDFVEEGRIGVVWSRMGGAQVRPDWRCRIDQRILCDRRALQPDSVAVRLVGRWLLEIEVADSQRECHREARTRVGEKLDERDISLVASRSGELLDIIWRQHLVAFGTLAVDTRPFDVVDPLDVGHIAEEQQDGVLIALDRRVGEVVVVAQREDKLVEVVLVHLDERDVGPLACGPSTPEVGLERSQRDRTVLLPDPAFDLFSVSVVDIVGFPEDAALTLEAALEVLRVVDRHISNSDCFYYNLLVNGSTSSTNSELIEAALKPANSSFSTGSKPHVTTAEPKTLAQALSDLSDSKAGCSA